MEYQERQPQAYGSMTLSVCIDIEKAIIFFEFLNVLVSLHRLQSSENGAPIMDRGVLLESAGPAVPSCNTASCIDFHFRANH